jgi:hypothetical protein
MPHGSYEGVLYGSDLKFVTDKKIRELLNNANCRPLMNKPKILIWAACRGGMQFADENVIDRENCLCLDLIEHGIFLPDTRPDTFN